MSVSSDELNSKRLADRSSLTDSSASARLLCSHSPSVRDAPAAAGRGFCWGNTGCRRCADADNKRGARPGRWQPAAEAGAALCWVHGRQAAADSCVVSGLSGGLRDMGGGRNIHSGCSSVGCREIQEATDASAPTNQLHTAPPAALRGAAVRRPADRRTLRCTATGWQSHTRSRSRSGTPRLVGDMRHGDRTLSLTVVSSLLHSSLLPSIPHLPHPHPLPSPTFTGHQPMDLGLSAIFCVV